MKFDIRTLSTDEIEMVLMVKKDVSEASLAEIEEASLEDFVPNNK